MLDLFAQLVDQTPACAVEAGQQAAPDVPAAPKPFAGNGVIHSEIGVGRPIAKMKGQIRAKAPVALRIGNTSGLIFRREHKHQFRLIAALNYLESAPFFQLADRISTDGGESSLVLEINEFCSEKARRQIATLLGVGREAIARTEDENKS